MTSICEKKYYPHKLVRAGEMLVIGDRPSIGHRDIVRYVIPAFRDLSDDQIGERLLDGDEVDMALVSRVGNVIEVEGVSSTFNYPPEDIRMKVRARTMELLQEKYPDEIFVEV
ncbi:MAG: hypothetical protein WC635_18160 [Bacteriovorax sp.]|jgi:hypothetical protein